MVSPLLTHWTYPSFALSPHYEVIPQYVQPYMQSIHKHVDTDINMYADICAHESNEACLAFTDVS